MTTSTHRSSDRQANCIFPDHALLGEAPLWDSEANQLLWLDLREGTLQVGTPESGAVSQYQLPQRATSIVRRLQGGLLLTTETGFGVMQSPSEQITLLDIPRVCPQGCRFNDGKCDTEGRFWVGTLALDGSPGRGCLYRLDPDGSVITAATGMHISNGIGWGPDNKRMYVTDSGARTIYQYDFDSRSGSIENRRVYYEHDDETAVPDGLCVDEDGFVWTALWEGWQVLRLDPDGAVASAIDLPVPKPTSCAFGGEDMRTLFVTSARTGLSNSALEQAPLSGSAFSIATSTRGLSVGSYGG